ncbi:MAG: 30S ribosomal protein S13 [bacterium]|nr:30S ribosomal protein S13 [bacterium]
MARISGVTLPANKRAEIALTYIFGIGLTRSKEILSAVDIDLNVKAKDLTEDEVSKITAHIQENNVAIEGDLRREVLANVKRLKESGAYRGTRHTKKLPSRGQSTKTNSRTVRGNVRRTMGSGRKVAAQKT